MPNTEDLEDQLIDETAEAESEVIESTAEQTSETLTENLSEEATQSSTEQAISNATERATESAGSATRQNPHDYYKSHTGIKGAVNRTKDRIHNAKESIKNTASEIKQAPKKMAHKIKSAPGNIKNGIKNNTVGRIKRAKDNVSNKFNKTLAGQIHQARKKAKPKGFKQNVKAIGKGIKNHFKDTKLAKMLKQIKEQLIKAFKFVKKNIKLISIIAALVGLVWPLIIFTISYVNAIKPTPHYYCDIDAKPSVKMTSLFQQYCSDMKGTSFEDMNGHYIIQDGSGPCLATSKINLLLRFYNYMGVNPYNYLWQADGQYLLTARAVCQDGSSNTIPKTMRAVANNGSMDTNLAHSNYSCKEESAMTRGFKWFANNHGYGNATMANWGYCADESVIVREWEDNSTSHIDTTNNEYWVWDLSLANNAPGTTWGGIQYTVNAEIEGINCHFKNVFSQSSSKRDCVKNDLIQAFEEYKSVCPDLSNTPGVLLYYDYPKAGGRGHHAVLITKYETKGTETIWYIVDPGIGTKGGFEGPILNSSTSIYNISTHAKGLLDLLNSGNCGEDFGLLQLWVVDPVCFTPGSDTTHEPTEDEVQWALWNKVKNDDRYTFYLDGTETDRTAIQFSPATYTITVQEIEPKRVDVNRKH